MDKTDTVDVACGLRGVASAGISESAGGRERYSLRVQHRNMGNMGIPGVMCRKGIVVGDRETPTIKEEL